MQQISIKKHKDVRNLDQDSHFEKGAPGQREAAHIDVQSPIGAVPNKRYLLSPFWHKEQEECHIVTINEC